MSSIETDHFAEHDEGYFASFTDLLVGVLFIFIILLMVFANNFNQKVSEITGIKESRDKVLKEIEQSLKNDGVIVSVDLEQGILRLPESILFAVNQSELSPDGVIKLGVVAKNLSKYLPSLAVLKEPDKEKEAFCDSLQLKSRDSLETVLIEGHTDYTGSSDRNWELSTQRAVSVFKEITKAEPLLDKGIVTKVKNQEGEEKEFPILAVSGYEARRPIEEGRPLEEEKRMKNRRIDLRFIMRSPSPPVLNKISSAMGDKP